jgi:uncharacterized membrane protein YhaH (DUF805 family)
MGLKEAASKYYQSDLIHHLAGIMSKATTIEGETMYFLQAYKDALAGIWSYADRSERLEVWTFMIVHIPVLFLIYTIADKLGRSEGMGRIALWVFTLGLLHFVLTFIPLLVRRLHDHNIFGSLLWFPAIFSSAGMVTMMASSGRLGQAYFNMPLWVFSDTVLYSGGSLLFFSLSVTLFIVWKGILLEGDEGSNNYGSPT